MIEAQHAAKDKMSSTMVGIISGPKITQLKGLLPVEISNMSSMRKKSSNADNTLSINPGQEQSRKDNETQVSFIKDPKLQNQIKTFTSQSAELEAIM